MIRQAKRNSPNTKLICASFADADIPRCDAATSLGEPLKYLNSGPLMRRTIKKVFQSLRRGGLFVFDVRHPPLGPIDEVHRVRSDRDWFCHSQTEEDANQLVRRITTFYRESGHFRRDQETHRLKLFSKRQMLQWLRDVGFRVQAWRGYGDYQLGERQSVFHCRKP
jgi:SAM-dependent methyltransferase